MNEPRIESYGWHGGREAMLRFGPADGPVVITALPLLEEANRTRAFTVDLLRALGRRRIGGVLPELPGQGESLVATRQMCLGDLRAAFAAAAGAGGDRVFGLAIRSGALLDDGAILRSRWHLAPQSAHELLREWRRIAGAEHGAPVEVAGNRLPPMLLQELASAPDVAGVGSGGSVRTVRLEGDPRPADLTVAGAPLWRRAEPGNDRVLVERLAEDIAQWIVRCGG